MPGHSACLRRNWGARFLKIPRHGFAIGATDNTKMHSKANVSGHGVARMDLDFVHIIVDLITARVTTRQPKPPKNQTTPCQDILIRKLPYGA